MSIFKQINARCRLADELPQVADRAFKLLARELKDKKVTLSRETGLGLKHCAALITGNAERFEVEHGMETFPWA